MTSQRVRQNVEADANPDVYVLLLTFFHPLLPGGVQRLSSDNATVIDEEMQQRGTISRGEVYHFLPMQAPLPRQGERVAPRMDVTIPDLASELYPHLLRTKTAALVSAEIVEASNPDLVEVSYAVFKMVQSIFTGESVTLSLAINDLSDEPYLADRFVPQWFPGLFKSY